MVCVMKPYTMNNLMQKCIHMLCHSLYFTQIDRANRLLSLPMSVCTPLPHPPSPLSTHLLPPSSHNHLPPPGELGHIITQWIEMKRRPGPNVNHSICRWLSQSGTSSTEYGAGLAWPATVNSSRSTLHPPGLATCVVSFRRR